MSRPVVYLIFAVALGLGPAASFAQTESPAGKAPAGSEEIKPKPGPAAKGAVTPAAPGAGQKQPVKPMAAEPSAQPKPAAETEAPKPTAQQPAAKPNEVGQTQPAAKPTAEQPAAKQPEKAARAAKPVDPQQQTRIREAVKTVNVKPEVNVNFHVDVGVRVPRTVHFYPLPTAIVEIVPEYRGYEFFLVGDEIVIVDPDSLEIVDVIPA